MTGRLESLEAPTTLERPSLSPPGPGQHADRLVPSWPTGGAELGGCLRVVQDPLERTMDNVVGYRLALLLTGLGAAGCQLDADSSDAGTGAHRPEVAFDGGTPTDAWAGGHDAIDPHDAGITPDHRIRDSTRPPDQAFGATDAEPINQQPDAIMAPCSEALEAAGELLHWPGDTPGIEHPVMRCHPFWDVPPAADSTACMGHLGLSMACMDCVTPAPECCPVACWNGTAATCRLCMRDRGCDTPPAHCEMGPWPAADDLWVDLDPADFEPIGVLQPDAIRPGRDVDWWAFVEGTHGPTWSAGDRCAGATRPAECQQRVDALLTTPPAACFESHCFEDDLHGIRPSFVVFTAGDRVGTITDRDAWGGFLAPIETAQEAAIVAASHELRWTTGEGPSIGRGDLPNELDEDVWRDWTLGSARRVDGGFELLVERAVNACPWTFERVHVRVTVDGVLTELRRQTAWVEEICS